MSIYTPMPLAQGLETAHLHLIRGELDAAENLLNTLHLVYPGTPEVMQMLGQIYDRRQAQSRKWHPLRFLQQSQPKSWRNTFCVIYLLAVILFMGLLASGIKVPPPMHKPSYFHRVDFGPGTAQIVLVLFLLGMIHAGIRDTRDRISRINRK